MLRLLQAPPNPPSPPASADLTNLCATPPLSLGSPQPVALALWWEGAPPNGSARGWSDGWRYFSAFRCGPRARNVCLAYRERAQRARLVGGLESADGANFSLRARVRAGLVVPASAWAMSENLAIVRDRGGYLLVGGRTPLVLAHASSWHYPEGTALAALPPARRPPHWLVARKVLNSTHPCIEGKWFEPVAAGRQSAPPVQSRCVYDGRLSIVRVRGRLFLYARADIHYGRRHVQMTWSDDEGLSWAPFRLIRIEGAPPAHECLALNIYFFAAQRNPVGNSSLIAIFPVAHRARGCIAISVSRDGLHWSAVRPVVNCATDRSKERTIHQPVAGMILEGGSVYIYIHENVPNLTHVQDMPRPRSRLVRYRVKSKRLARWSEMALRSIIPEDQSTTSVERLPVERQLRQSLQMRQGKQ
ncbi:hypothetical protein AB1Y20_022782 [Prymnesium parvum]|uniref:Sialidase domain-containing protein n=1 Tax=Prymnesium parvum TaxID=97485 RepID=A0AB34JDV8_PRYPA